MFALFKICLYLVFNNYHSVLVVGAVVGHCGLPSGGTKYVGVTQEGSPHESTK